MRTYETGSRHGLDIASGEVETLERYAPDYEDTELRQAGVAQKWRKTAIGRKIMQPEGCTTRYRSA
jgi:hypothetical protein